MRENSYRSASLEELETQRMWPRDGDVGQKMREANRLNWVRSQKRIDRYWAAKNQNAIQIVPSQPLDINLPAIFRGIIDKIKFASGGFRLFHFSLQLGRLSIELSTASRKNTSVGP